MPPVNRREAYRRSAFPAAARVDRFSIGVKRFVTGLALAALCVVALAFVAISLGGCAESAKTAADIAALEQLGECVTSVYAADSAKTPVPTGVDIAIDIATTCAADVVDVVNVLGQPSNTPAQQAVAIAAQLSAATIHQHAAAARRAQAGR
jgi:hypothetical protein